MPSDSREKSKLELELSWAAQLHEIGFIISHQNYHKHGAYLLDHVDAMGFSMDELHKIAQLILGHKGKLRKLGDSLYQTDFIKQLLALRLAVLICHSRQDNGLTKAQPLRIKIESNKNPVKIQMTITEEWAKNYPQSHYLLLEEVLAWEKLSCTFFLLKI